MASVILEQSGLIVGVVIGLFRLQLHRLAAHLGPVLPEDLRHFLALALRRVVVVLWFVGCRLLLLWLEDYCKLKP